MRRAITLGFRGETAVVLAGPEVPLPQQVADFKTAVAAERSPDFDSIEVWSSGRGVIKKRKFGKEAKTEGTDGTDQTEPAADETSATQNQPTE